MSLLQFGKGYEASVLLADGNQVGIDLQYFHIRLTKVDGRLLSSSFEHGGDECPATFLTDGFAALTTWFTLSEVNVLGMTSESPNPETGCN